MIGLAEPKPAWLRVIESDKESDYYAVIDNDGKVVVKEKSPAPRRSLPCIGERIIKIFR